MRQNKRNNCDGKVASESNQVVKDCVRILKIRTDTKPPCSLGDLCDGVQFSVQMDAGIPVADVGSKQDGGSPASEPRKRRGDQITLRDAMCLLFLFPISGHTLSVIPAPVRSSLPMRDDATTALRTSAFTRNGNRSVCSTSSGKQEKPSATA